MSDGATGVDVSWLHHTHKDYAQRLKPHAPSNRSDDPPPPTSSSAQHKAENVTESIAANAKAIDNADKRNGTQNFQAQGSIAQLGTSPKQHHALKRPHLRPRISNGTMDKVAQDGNGTASPASDQGQARSPGASRRNSWISNLSSKFSSVQNSPPPTPSFDQSSNQKKPPPSPKAEAANPFNTLAQPVTTKDERAVETTPPSSRPQGSSFLSSALRRLSSSGSGGLGRLAGSGTTVQRRVLNVDHNRERCRVPDLEKTKLKRVSFCVDVEIAGYARYDGGDENKPSLPNANLGMLEREVSNKKKRDTKEAKVKDKGEGATLKDPGAAVQEKETNGIIQANQEDVGTTESPKPEGVAVDGELSTSPPTAEPASTKKKEKKKRSEAERKERKEKKRRLAEANGDVPLELTREEEESSSGATSPGTSTPPNGKPQTRPTLDPLRIYKRCAQLRETPALKKILDQISAPSCTLSEAPGTVAVLDLTGVWVKMPDIVTLGDWLAIVPVRKLILENCGLTDEAVRVILSGLLACKTPEQARHNRKLAKKCEVIDSQELLGVIEKVSLKENPKITRAGWEHIGLFMHLSRSLKAIDLSGIPFPKPNARMNSKTNGAQNDTSEPLCSIISKGLAQRYGGNRLEELIMGQCSLSARNVSNIVDGAIACGLRRLGLAENNLTSEAIEHVVRYLKSGLCEGLDLGGNYLHGELQPLADALDDQNPLVALSLAACDVNTTDLSAILPSVARLENFRFIDLSQNRDMFASQPNALSLLRRYLPQIRLLKRIHLNDVDLTPDDTIGLAEILPECKALAHVSILENPKLVTVADSKDRASQEEAMAVYTSLMTAVRCSQSIVAIDIEPPHANSNEVVKAVASQILAFSLRNLERLPLTPNDGETPAPTSSNELGKSAPEVLLHLVGHMEGYEGNADEDATAPGEDYYISATGVVKALGVCLGTADHSSRRPSRDHSPAPSGTATPRIPSKPIVHKKPKDMSRELLETARKIKTRLRPAMIKEDREGNDYNYRRLQFLHTTLERIIQRFEDEYPETRSVPISRPTSHKDTADSSSITSSFAEPSALSVIDDPLARVVSNDDHASVEHEDSYSIKLSRTSSNTSLRTRALTSEEGRMHRFGQQIRREILKPEGLDYAHGTDENSVDPPHLALLRSKLSTLQGDQLRDEVIEKGYEKVVEELGANAEELAQLEKEDPEGFQKLKEAHFVALKNQKLTTESMNCDGHAEKELDESSEPASKDQ